MGGLDLWKVGPVIQKNTNFKGSVVLFIFGLQSWSRLSNIYYNSDVSLILSNLTKNFIWYMT